MRSGSNGNTICLKHFFSEVMTAQSKPSSTGVVAQFYIPLLPVAERSLHCSVALQSFAFLYGLFTVLMFPERYYLLTDLPT
jgi:hypothetical protein